LAWRTKLKVHESAPAASTTATMLKMAATLREAA